MSLSGCITRLHHSLRSQNPVELSRYLEVRGRQPLFHFRKQVKIELMSVGRVPEDVTLLVLEVEVDDGDARVLIDPGGDDRSRGCAPRRGPKA